MSNEIHGTARIVIHDGKLEEFKRLAAQCLEIVRTRDTGTIEYDQFLNAEARSASSMNATGLGRGPRAHENIAPMMKPLSEICTITGEICGSPSPELRKALEAAGVTIYAPLGSLHG